VGLRAAEAIEPVRACTDHTMPVANPLDLIYDAFFVRSMDSAIQYWNRAAEELYGWTAEEAVGRVSYELIKTLFPAPLEAARA
jgi:PAS domain-containing protein